MIWFYDRCPLSTHISEHPITPYPLAIYTKPGVSSVILILVSFYQFEWSFINAKLMSKYFANELKYLCSLMWWHKENRSNSLSRVQKVPASQPFEAFSYFSAWFTSCKVKGLVLTSSLTLLGSSGPRPESSDGRSAGFIEDKKASAAEGAEGLASTTGLRCVTLRVRALVPASLLCDEGNAHLSYWSGWLFPVLVQAQDKKTHPSYRSNQYKHTLLLKQNRRHQ